MPSKTIEPVVFRRLPGDPERRPWYFISLRWQVVAPLLALVLLVAMIGSYVIVDTIASEAHQQQVERLLRTQRAVTERMAEIDALQQRELARVTYTERLVDYVVADDVTALHAILEPVALAADLDYVLITGRDGREIIGLQRVPVSGQGGAGQQDYAVASGTDLSALPAEGARLWRTGQGHALLTAGPLLRGDKVIGTVAVGLRLERVIAALRGADEVDLALYGAQAEFLYTTLPFDEAMRDALILSPAAYQETLSTPGEVLVAGRELTDQRYNAAYTPFVVGGTPLGVLALFAEDDTLYATAESRRVYSLLAAGLMAGVVLVTFAVVGRFAGRLERITRTAHALASGDARARTGMRAGDEIGELGVTLDRMAERHARRTDTLQKALRQQRTESARLLAILESVPDGLVVQDLDGRVLLINEAARELLGGHRAFRAARLHELTAVVTETLGPALAPGIYALGDPTRISLQERMLQAQAAAIQLRTGKRIGTVIVLRDITAEVQRAQAREALLDRLAEGAVAPSAPRAYESLSALAQEVVRNTRAIQGVIAELRDLNTFEPRDLESGQHPLPVNELLWNVAAEWQPLANVAHIRLQVKFGPRGQYVLGDDRRLRWAIGNLIDNALKYSPPRTEISLVARQHPDNEQAAQIVVQDQGYGIAPDDLANAFTRFYRGKPRDHQGKQVRKPGTGQGLFIARRVIEAHGGQIELSSRVGSGTTAVIVLPLTAPVALVVPERVEEPVVIEPDEDEVMLSRGGGYDTVPLEPHVPRWRRRH